jgi:hypothetical protein
MWERESIRTIVSATKQGRNGGADMVAYEAREIYALMALMAPAWLKSHSHRAMGTPIGL